MTRRPLPGGRPHRTARTRSRRSRAAGLGTSGRRRAFVTLFLIGGAVLAICVKLVDIQALDSAQYLAVAGSEWDQTVTLPGERGAILDRNGYELAISVPQTTIYADPHQVDDPNAEAAELSPVLGISAATLRQELTSASSFVYLARTVSDPVASAVQKLELPGIYGLEGPRRFYPAGQLAIPLLGSVGTDGNGLSALEYEYNSLLAGQPGRAVEETDPQGDQLPGGLRQYKAPVAGQDLVLSIDEPLQYDAEQALAQAVVAARAQGGIALLMDTATGQILADAQLTMPAAGSSEPPAVPVDIPGASADDQPVEAPSASAFTRVYEPGSVNKLITISAGLQTGVIKPSDVFTIPDAYEVSGEWFHDAESHPTERWTVTDILANSSNIGTIEIAQRLGKPKLLRYISSYGLGSITDVHFPGESAGLLPTYWSGTSIADVPIGQGIAVTAAQMLAAYNTIANGGVYVPPRLVDATIDSHGVEHVLPEAPRHRVVSETVARQMTTMLDEVVRVGTGTAANLDPYTVAGKTGTALVPSPRGGYEQGHYVASFAGFVPSERPQITGMVVVDDTPDYGAAASAPTFATIARDALERLDIPPMRPLPPAPGVPLATPATATGAGDVAGSPLPDLSSPPQARAEPHVTAASGDSAASGGPWQPGTPSTGAPTTVALAEPARSRSSSGGP